MIGFLDSTLTLATAKGKTGRHLCGGWGEGGDGIIKEEEEEEQY